MEIRNRTDDSPSGISFKPIGKRGDYIQSQIVLKREGDQLKYNDAKVARDAVGQFKTLLESAVESVEDRKRSRENNEGVLVERNTEYIGSEFPGLTDQEKREIGGVLNPPEGQSAMERAYVLEIEANHLGEEIENTEPGERLESLRKSLALVERGEENLAVREVSSKISQDSKS